MHRLNRAEYNNTVRDLLGTTLRPADDFTADNSGDGFDNIAELLSLSTVQLQLYQKAAESLIESTLAGANRSRVLACDLATGPSCLQNTLRAFAKRAWRRPVTDAELAGFVTVANDAKTAGDTAEIGLTLALEALLIAPDFLFRIEFDPDPASTTPHAITDYELASRLSYFIWSSMPDDGLFAAADAGNLHDPNVLQTQIARMMKDTKAVALVDNFAGQWLYTRLVPDLKPDATLFPMFDDELRTAMRQETELMFKDIAFGGTPADQLVTGNFTFLNDRLAAHYGLPAVGSKTLKKVTVTSDQRGGLLGQASLLTATSHPTLTSPVNRGKWLMNQILCVDVPPPPGNVNTALPPPTPGSTRRQQLEAHKNKDCASCHKLMDPIGFGFENYDPVGAYRTMDNGAPVDASGNYLEGQPFSGIHQLAGLIAADSRFANCMTQKVYTYALGRPPQDSANHMDPYTIDTLTTKFIKGGFKFESLVQNLAASDTFLKRRGESASAGGTQ